MQTRRLFFLRRPDSKQQEPQEQEKKPTRTRVYTPRQQVYSFADIKIPDCCVSLDLRGKQIENFIGFPESKEKIKYLTQLNLDSNPIKSFEGLPLISSNLHWLSVKNSPLSKSVYLKLMAVIVFGRTLTTVNNETITEKIYKQADELRNSLLPELLNGRIISNLKPLRFIDTKTEKCVPAEPYLLQATSKIGYTAPSVQEYNRLISQRTRPRFQMPSVASICDEIILRETDYNYLPNNVMDKFLNQLHALRTTYKAPYEGSELSDITRSQEYIDEEASPIHPSNIINDRINNIARQLIQSESDESGFQRHYEEELFLEEEEEHLGHEEEEEEGEEDINEIENKKHSKGEGEEEEEEEEAQTDKATNESFPPSEEVPSSLAHSSKSSHKSSHPSAHASTINEEESIASSNLHKEEELISSSKLHSEEESQKQEKGSSSLHETSSNKPEEEIHEPSIASPNSPKEDESKSNSLIDDINQSQSNSLNQKEEEASHETLFEEEENHEHQSNAEEEDNIHEAPSIEGDHKEENHAPEEENSHEGSQSTKDEEEDIIEIPSSSKKEEKSSSEKPNSVNNPEESISEKNSSIMQEEEDIQQSIPIIEEEEEEVDDKMFDEEDYDAISRSSLLQMQENIVEEEEDGDEHHLPESDDSNNENDILSDSDNEE